MFDANLLNGKIMERDNPAGGGQSARFGGKIDLRIDQQLTGPAIERCEDAGADFDTLRATAAGFASEMMRVLQNHVRTGGHVAGQFASEHKLGIRCWKRSCKD